MRRAAPLRSARGAVSLCVAACRRADSAPRGGVGHAVARSHRVNLGRRAARARAYSPPPIDDHPATSRGIGPRVWFGRHGTECSGGNGRRFESVAGSVKWTPPPSFSPWYSDRFGMVWSSYVWAGSRIDRNVFRPNRMCTRAGKKRRMLAPQPPDVRITFFWSLRLNGTSFISLCGVPLTARTISASAMDACARTRKRSGRRRGSSLVFAR